MGARSKNQRGGSAELQQEQTMGYETEDSVKQELRDLLRRLRTHGCAPSDDQAVQVAEMLVQIWRLDSVVAQDMVEEALVCPSWPTVAMCHLRLQAARLGKRGQIAVDALWTRWSRLMQPDWRLPESERLKHKKEAWALRDELDLWTARVHSGETPAEDLVKWACTIEPHLEGWLKAAEVADG
jgi:hypothetical protein